MLEFDLWTIVFSIINILVLYLFLKKFLFGRVQAMMDQRAALVQKDLDNAKSSKEQAEQLRSQYEQSLSDAKTEAGNIIAAAKATAQQQSDAITAEAQKEAERLVDAAHKEIALERQSTMDGAKQEIADLALAAAAKLVQSQMGAEENRNIVDAFLAGEGVES